MIIKIEIPIWNATLFVHDNREEYNEKLSRTGRNPISRLSQAHMSSIDHEHDMFLAEDSGPGRIAHESLHATTQILGMRGVVGLDMNNDETVAYLLDFIVANIHKERNNVSNRPSAP